MKFSSIGETTGNIGDNIQPELIGIDDSKHEDFPKHVDAGPEFRLDPSDRVLKDSCRRGQRRVLDFQNMVTETMSV